jgi:hypothetical protein
MSVVRLYTYAAYAAASCLVRELYGAHISAWMADDFRLFSCSDEDLFQVPCDPAFFFPIVLHGHHSMSVVILYFDGSPMFVLRLC